MKHYLVIAGLLVSLGASAQSNVQIYGAADATFDVVKTSGASNRGTFNRVNSNSSILGFRGSEDLGNGLSAIFQLESGINLDSTGGVPSTGRTSFVGIKSANYGTVVFGLLSSPTREVGAALDLNTGVTGPGSNSSIIGKVTGGSGASTFDTRLQNAVAYISPTINGLTTTVAYSAGENRSLENAKPADKINTKGYDFGLKYTVGPIDTYVSYAILNNNRDDEAAGSNINKVNVVRTAAVYNYGVANKVTFLIERDKNEYSGIKAAEIDRVIWGLGVKHYVTTNGAIITQYYQAKDPSGSYYDVNGNRGARLIEIGYEHSLSKRTILKATYATMRNEANANYDFNTGAVGGGVVAGTDLSVLSVGMRHSF